MIRLRELVFILCTMCFGVATLFLTLNINHRIQNPELYFAGYVETANGVHIWVEEGEPIHVAVDFDGCYQHMSIEGYMRDFKSIHSDQKLVIQ